LHVRSAVGVNELPLNAAVEVEMIVRTKWYSVWSSQKV
jgi:enamine deaminase RidA (YjgF/YER057c/UK114 family)